MVFDNIWEIWPFRHYYSTTNSRRHNRQSSRCGVGTTKGHSEPLAKILGPWESNMVALQSILIWEKPRKSAVVLFVANLIYWYMVCSEVRIFFGISILGLIAFVRHQWVTSIWPEISVPKSPCEQEEWTPIHPSVLSAPEVSRYLNKIWTYIQGQQNHLAQLRRRQPGLFCIIMLVIFSLLWLLGRVVSGVTLLYVLLMGVMCGPAFIFRFVPKSVFKKVEQIFDVLFGKRDNSSQSDKDLEDFLPEESSAEVQTALGIPLTSHEIKDEDLNESSKSMKGKSSMRSRRGKSKSRSTEVGSSFTVGLSESDFPSLEETTDTLEESDLVPEVVTPRVTSADMGMNFVSTHFGDSSDEDEEFSLGLAFNRDPQPMQGVSEPQSLVPSIFSNAGNFEAHVDTIYSHIGQQFASAIGSRVLALAHSTPTSPDTSPPEEDSTPTPTKVANSDSSCEEDFELISDDDLQ